MKFKPTPIAAAVALACMGAASALAQEKTEKVEKIEVTGIRGSMEKSVESKRNADSVVEVITAEDIGKMPDKNIADSLQRVPGVTTSSQSGGSGGFDENDRVSLRGTNPSLTQTLVNGHAIASGDWRLSPPAKPVSMAPGATAFTRMSFGPSSWASALVNMRTPPFDAL